MALTKRAGLFVLCFFTILIGSMPLGFLIAFSIRLQHVGELLFFLPQYMLAFFGSVYRTTAGSQPAFSSITRGTLTLAAWTLTMLGFACLTRKRSLKFATILAPATIIAVTILLNLALKAFGITVELDGP